MFGLFASSALYSSEVSAQTACTGSSYYCPAGGCTNRGTATNPNCSCSGNQVPYDDCEIVNGSCVADRVNQSCVWNGSACVISGGNVVANQLCGDGGGGGGGGGGSGCTQTCRQESGCMRQDNLCCRQGNQGSSCGTANDGTPKFNCSCTLCTTVCPTPAVDNPKGYHDASSCQASAGWACDPNDYNAALQIHFYADGPAGTGVFLGATTANLPREAAVGTQCGGNPNHGFNYPHPDAFRSGNHTIYAYAINIGLGTTNPLLTLSPKSYSCPTPTTSPAYCQDIKAYTEQWGLLSATQLAQMVAGQKANFCVRGTASTGSFTKARFTINGTLTPETTRLRPGTTTDFCHLYTIPTGRYTFNVIGEIYNSVLGWLR